MSEPINRVFTNFLDRMLDEIAKSAENMAQVKSTLTELRNEVDEIKEHVTDEVSKNQAQIKEVRETLIQIALRLDTDEERRLRSENYKKLTDFLLWARNPKTYISIFVAFVVATASLIGGVVAVVSKIEPYIRPAADVQPSGANGRPPSNAP